MVKVTEENAHELHKEIWTWLADNPDKGSDDWPRWEKKGGDVQNVKNDCFACEINKMRGGEECKRCPITWEGPKCTNDPDYMLWSVGTDHMAFICARRVRDKEWK